MTPKRVGTTATYRKLFLVRVNVLLYMQPSHLVMTYLFTSIQHDVGDMMEFSTSFRSFASGNLTLDSVACPVLRVH